MKLAHFLLAAAVCSFSAASAQTTPSQTTPNTSNPSAVPSGTAPMPSNPNGAVSAGEVFTTGSPNNASDKRTMKHKKNKSTDGTGKMKTKM
ncbi:MAG: hypothetical protein ACRYG7_42005 [Janthinobacterium lividum]